MRTSTKIGAAVAAVGGTGLAVLGVLRAADDRYVDRVARELASGEPAGRFDEGMLDGLPAPVQRYFRHAIRPGTPLASHAVLHMTGELDAGRGWMPLTAEEVIAPGRGFVWTVYARQGVVSLRGADLYYRGYARVRIRLFGLLPVVSADSPATARSAVGRLAGESVWCPSGLLPGHGVQWRAIDETHAALTMTIDGEATACTLAVEPDGRLREVVVQRYNDDPKRGIPGYLPFGIAVEEEGAFGGYTIPTRLRGGWYYGTPQYREFVRFTVTEAQFG